jgi:membrane-associated phospholipid phosphatase
MSSWESTWDWGLQIIRSIQQYHFPLLDAVMIVITAIGTEEFYMLFVCFLLWNGHHRLGVRLAVWLALAGSINADLKNVFGHPRPFELEPSVQLVRTSGYGFPSGHAQAAMVVWGYLASHCSQTRYKWAAAAAILAIGFSRIYLGVHFPTDVLAGWIIGFILLVSCLASEPLLIRLFQSFGRYGRIALSIGVPFALAAAYPLAGSARPLGMAAGLTSGYLLLQPTQNPEMVSNRVVRFLAGVSGLLLLSAAGKGALSHFSSQTSIGFIVSSFLTGALLGAWASAGAPRLFDLLGLNK